MPPSPMAAVAASAPVPSPRLRQRAQALLAMLAMLAALVPLTATAQAAATPAPAADASAAAPPAPVAPTAPAYRGLGAASVAPQVLAQFRPPPLADDIAARIQGLLDLRAPGAGVLSPDGKRLFFTWRITGVDQVWRLDGPGAFPRQLTGGQDRTTVAAVSPDGRWLALQRDRRGEENPGLYLQSPEGGALVAVQHLPGVQTLFQGFSDDGRFLYYVANERRRDGYGVYRRELASGRSELLHDGEGYWRIGDLQPGRLLLVKHTGSIGREWSLLDEATGRLTPLLGQGEHEDHELQFAPRAGEYFATQSRGTGFRRLYRWSPGRGFDPVALAGSPRHDVEQLQQDRAGRRLYVTVNEAGFLRTSALDAATLKPLPLPWPAGADHQQVASLTPDGRHAVLSVSPPDRPRESLVHDWRTGTTQRWIAPSLPEVDTRRFAAARVETYPARDGTPIPMVVRRPPHCEPAAASAAPPCPVIVHFHGGPEGQSKPGFSLIWQLFVDAGFVVAEPNVRGSTGYGRAWLDADNGPRRLQVITDIEDVALHLRRSGARDGAAPRLGVYGGSYGGYATLMAMTRFAGAYDAGVSNVGIANLLTFLENTAPYRRTLRITEYGDPVRDREALAQLSPTTWVHRLNAPLLIVQGVNDPRVPVGEALQMHDAAKARGVPLELMLFADEGHGASSRANVALQWGHTLRFFRQHLMQQP